MLINEKFLLSAGAELKHYNSGEIIFQEGKKSGYYYQMVKGTVKLCSHDHHHKEFIHTLMREGQSFGDFLLFSEKPFPTTAVALGKCEILRLCTVNFFSMLDIYPQLYSKLFKSLSERFYNQSIMMQKESEINSGERFKRLFDCI